MENDVVMGDMLRALMIVGAGLSAVGAVAVFTKDMKRARHAQMHDQDVAGGEVGDEIFRAPADAGYLLAFQPLRKVLGQRPAQVAAPDLDLDEARVLHRRLEATAHRLNFGKL